MNSKHSWILELLGVALFNAILFWFLFHYWIEPYKQRIDSLEKDLMEMVG